MYFFICRKRFVTMLCEQILSWRWFYKKIYIYLAILIKCSIWIFEITNILYYTVSTVRCWGTKWNTDRRYFSSANFTSTPVRGHRHPGDGEKETGRERRWGRAKSHPDSAAARWAPTRLPPLGPAEQHTTAGSATFITYRLFPCNSKYQSLIGRPERTVKLWSVSH